SRSFGTRSTYFSYAPGGEVFGKTTAWASANAGAIKSAQHRSSTPSNGSSPRCRLLGLCVIDVVRSEVVRSPRGQAVSAPRPEVHQSRSESAQSLFPASPFGRAQV